MQNFKIKRIPSFLSIFLFIGSLASLLVGINGYPQWVWNRDAIDLGSQSLKTQSSSSSNFPASPLRDSNAPIIPQGSVRVVNSQPRFFTSAISSAVSNSIGGGNSGGSGGVGGLFGAVLQNIPQYATQAISGVSGLFSRPPITLPAKDPGNVDTSDDSIVPTNGACNCVSGNECFLPSKATGSCAGGRVQCCSTSRTLFPGDDTKGTKNGKTISQREIRRGLLKNILKGSGSIVDDTLDFLLQPFLSTEDQQKIAIRVVDDE